MWVPRSAEELEKATTRGDLEETHTFDGKALPGKNKDIAIDVCAMTVQQAYEWDASLREERRWIRRRGVRRRAGARGRSWPLSDLP